MLRSIVLAIALSWVVANTAAAQVFTPTQAPKTRIVQTPLELADLKIPTESLAPACGLANSLKADRVLDAAKTEASILRRLFDDAVEKLPKEKRATPSKKDLDAIYKLLNAAIVDLSVASRRSQWTAAIVKGQSAAARLTNFTYEGLALDSAESAAATRATRAAGCAAEWLATKAKAGPDANFGLLTKTFWFLPGAGVTTGSEEATDLSLKAAEFYFSNHWRLYVHSTVTLEKAKPEEGDAETDEEADADDEADAAGDEAETPDPNEVAESVKSALLNPYGSPLYLTAGYLRKIRTPFFDGDANDADHGLFFDSRFGLKFLPLPEESLELIEGETRNTAFYVGSAALRLRLPLYKEAPFIAGEDGIDVALTAAVNRISNTGASTLFQGLDGNDPLIPKTVVGAHLAIGVSLPKLANVVISGTLWSNTKFDKRFLISINLQKSDPEVPATNETTPK